MCRRAATLPFTIHGFGFVERRDEAPREPAAGVRFFRFLDTPALEELASFVDGDERDLERRDGDGRDNDCSIAWTAGVC